MARHDIRICGRLVTGNPSFLRETLDVLILRSLEGGPRHGYEVVTHLADGSRGTVQIEDGALYHALHRLGERGLVTAEWGRAESGKRVRYHRLTPRGRDRLREQTWEWHEHADAVRRILDPGQTP